jgi:hypothetical protein
MAAPYRVEGDSFRAEKPRLWSQERLTPTSRENVFDLHPDGERLAVAAAVPDAQTTTVQNKVVFTFNFFDELRRIAPAGKK